MKKIFTILAAAALTICAANAQELANFSRGASIKSPEINGDKVTFRLSANYATQVNLVGAWMADPYGAGQPMTKGEGGVWEITVDTPSPEIYTYSFVVDGVTVNDPLNYYVQRDGTRYLNMLIVPGERTENYVEADQRGTVSYRWYDSKILGINRRMTVYTPYGYEANPKAKYPVLYLLHGGGGDEEAWTSMGRTAQIMDNLIQKGLAKPMIVVMPNGNPTQQAAAPMGLENNGNASVQNAYVKSLCEEIVPFIEKEYRAIPKPASRAIAGLSMGGGHTLAASQNYPSMFDYICPLSISSQDTPEIRQQLRNLKKDGYKLYWFGVGETDFLIDGARTLDKVLTEEGLEHTFFLTDGGHEWKNWRLYLNTFGQLLFK